MSAKVNDGCADAGIRRRMRVMENVATCGLLLICVALVVPFITAGDMGWLSVFKWVYSAGALAYVVARVAGVRESAECGESVRIRRLRRMEFWGGVAFMAGAVFWFVQEGRYEANPYMGVLAVMRDTVMFTLAGALIQVIASWMIVSRLGKENKEKEN